MWFAGGEPHALDDEQHAFVAALAGRLAEVAPAGVDVAGTAVRVEPGRADAVIPHRFFGGLAIAVSLLGREVQVAWLRVHSLNRSDDFDAVTDEGWPRFEEIMGDASGTQRVLDHIVREMRREFVVRTSGRRLEVVLDGTSLWKERRPGQSPERRFAASFTTPIEEIERRLAQG
jgi:hypothetical protein